MRSIVHIFVNFFVTNEEFRQQLASYDRFLKSEDGKFFMSMLAVMRGLIANDLFSAEFTKQKSEEKDVQQRAYFHLSQVLSFLAEPRKFIEKKTVWNMVGFPNLKGRSSDKPKK